MLASAVRAQLRWVLLAATALCAVACDEADQGAALPTRAPTDAGTARTGPAPTATRTFQLPRTETTAGCEASGVFCADASGMTAAVVIRIIDGDTLDVSIDGDQERVRIFGVDTAERGERCFAEASSLLRDLAGAEVRLRRDARDRDPNGRLLRYIYTPDGVSIDALLIAEGLAFAWTRDGALRDALIALESEARAANRGCLWGG